MTNEKKPAGLAEFAKVEQRQFATVEHPEIGPIRLQSLTEGERATIWQKVGDDPGCLAAQVLIACVVDAEGLRVFSDADWQRVQGFNSGVVQWIYAAVNELCGFDPEIELESIKEQVKNSLGIADDCSRSD